MSFAVLASNVAPADMVFSEAKCAELSELSRKLRQQALIYAMATSADTKDGVFGPNTSNIEFRAKSSWVVLRGNRYQVLEGEFYRYVLVPHDDVLREIYGVSAAEVAQGFQAMADATRSGHADAIALMTKQFDAAQAFAAAKDKRLEEVVETWRAANGEQAIATGRAVDDMFRNGIANVSRHTKLPPTLLADWSENDTLVLIDDVLFLVEAKAGAAATIASPALDFDRHAQSVQDLVVKAYKQCQRFINYLDSAEEVPLYRLAGGNYEECGRVRRSDYRVMIPIGLTVESFSPFSTYRKELPQVEPLLPGTVFHGSDPTRANGRKCPSLR